MLKTYFSDVRLDSSFKLHYYDLRMCNDPYDKIGSVNRRKLERDIFSIIKKSNARLLSFIIDLEDHYNYYADPFDPLSYGLLCMVERLRSYMTDFNIKQSQIIYERFDRHLRNRVYVASKKMKKANVQKANLGNLSKYVCYGDPREEVVLQFVDFWAYLPFNEECKRLQVYEFRLKYYNYNKPKNAGNIRITYGL